MKLEMMETTIKILQRLLAGELQLTIDRANVLQGAYSDFSKAFAGAQEISKSPDASPPVTPAPINGKEEGK